MSDDTKSAQGELRHSPSFACCGRVAAAADLFVEPPPAARTWPDPLPRTCRQPWPLYTSAGISLCVIPGGKLQLPVLSKRWKTKAVLTVFKSREERKKKKESELLWRNSYPELPGLWSYSRAGDKCL